MHGAPSPEYVSFSQSPGRTSPDINSLISGTPSPKRRQLRRKDPTSATHSTSSSVSSTLGNLSSPSETPELEPRSFTPLLSALEDLQRSSEDSGSESDSSLDLHTPFAHIMFRDGYISPRSRLMAQLTPSGIAGKPPASKTQDETGSKFFKDERDTIKRRIRHRDGKLLKEGIGLTTGLGWSDSEDEGVPSTFVRTPSNASRLLSPKSASRANDVESLRRLAVNGAPSIRPSASSPILADLRKSERPSLQRRTSIPRPSALSESMSSQSTIKWPTAGYHPIQPTQQSRVVRPLLLDPNRAANNPNVAAHPVPRSQTFSDPPTTPPQSTFSSAGIALGGVQYGRSSPPRRTFSYRGQRQHQQQHRVGTSTMYKRSVSVSSLIVDPFNTPSVRGNITPPSSLVEDNISRPPSPQASEIGIGIAI